MLPDLPTLLLVRLGVDVLIVGAFWSLMRRYPAIGGPGWWSLGSLISILGTLALMWRSGGAGPLVAAASAVLLLGGNACAWLGLRSYLKLSMPWRVLGTVLGVHAVLQVGLALQGDRSGPHQLVYSVAGLVLVALVLRDLVGLKAQRSVREYQELTLVTVVEGVTLLLVVGWMVSRQQPLDRVAAGFMLAFLLTKIFRALIYSALVSLRLRQDVERARKAMAEREAGSRALITHLGAGVVVFRPDRSVVSANNAARCFFGWPIDDSDPAEIPPMPAWRLVRENGARMPRHEVPFERVLATGQPVIGMVGGIVAGSDRAARWALCNAYPENDAIGGLRHVVFTFVDITSLKQAQQQQRKLETQLAQSQKMEALGTLAGGVAHDFNNILAAILGNADLARQDLAPASPARESLHEISSAARRGRELVRQILAFSRQQPLARTPVRPGAIVAETCSLLRTAIAPHVQLVQQVAPKHHAILADPTQLGQVLLNLGPNAVHALRPGLAGVRGPGLPRQRAERGAHQRERRRLRHGRAHARAHVRAFFHHQGGGPRHRAGLAGGAGHRGGPRRRDRGGEQPRRRHDLHALLPRDRRTASPVVITRRGHFAGRRRHNGSRHKWRHPAALRSISGVICHGRRTEQRPPPHPVPRRRRHPGVPRAPVAGAPWLQGHGGL